MKRISHRAYANRSYWLFIAIFVAWGWPYDKPQETGRYAGQFVLFWSTVFAVGWIMEWVFGSTVYDDGDALVVIKRGRRIRIPFSNISRVAYEGAGNSPIVKLGFSEPCELGKKFRFQVAARLCSPDHNEIVDDLHHRSRCCKGPAGCDRIEAGMHAC